MGLHFDSTPPLSAMAVYISLPPPYNMDRDIIRQALAYRSKYRTKRQPPRQVLSCLQVVPHPSNMGPEIRRSETTKRLAAKTCHEGYNPIEAELESVCVESEIFDCLTSLRFTRHFQDNVENGPGHYVCPNAIIEFGSLSNSTLCLCDRNMRGGMRGVCMFTTSFET